jgi:hypothetical protein
MRFDSEISVIRKRNWNYRGDYCNLPANARSRKLADILAGPPGMPGFVSTARIRDRKPNLKSGAAPRRTMHFNRPGMDLGNPAADREA